MGVPIKRRNQRNPPSRKPNTSMLDKISADNTIAFTLIIAFLILGILIVVMILERTYIATIITALLSSFTGLIGYVKGKNDNKNDQ